MNWFKELKDLFKTEKPRTIIRVAGNKLNVVWLDGTQKPIKWYMVKFKNATKLKKFWEVYCYGGVVNYYKPEKMYWSEQLLSIKKFR